MKGNFLPGEEHALPYDECDRGSDHQKGKSFEWTIIPVFLFMICGLFFGGFMVAILLRRLAIALALTGPLLFTAVWIWWDWDRFHDRHFALGAFAVGFTLTFLALDREP